MNSNIRVLAAVLLFCFAVATVGAAPQQEAAKRTRAGFELPAATDKRPKLASAIKRAADSFDAKGAQWRSDFAEGELMIDGDLILVEIRCSGQDAKRMLDEYTAKGMKVRHHNVPSLVEAWVPVSRLKELEADDAVRFIRSARLAKPRIGDTDTEELALSMADLWHASGLDGTGVTIGNIDGGYIGFAARQATNDWPSGAQLTIVDINGGAFGTVTDHGTNTVELNYDMAPGADFVVYETTTLGDWYAALLQAPSDGVDIASVSLGAPLDGVGDGSECPPNFAVPCGSIAEGSGIARSQGVLVVNAAGNERDNHWGGLYNDSITQPGLHDFGPGIGVVLQSSVCLGAGAQFLPTLHWDDWTAVNHDYDLLVTRLVLQGGMPTWIVHASSTNPQSGLPGQTPEEILLVTSLGQTSPGCPAGTSNFGFAIQRFNAPTDRNLQLFTDIPLFDFVPGRSLGFPADSPNVLSVGAVDVNTVLQEPYSSEGPVLGPGGSLAPSSILKPDLMSVANVSTESAGAGGFNGTSSATPHVAGIAAVVLQANPTFDVDQLEAELLNIASMNDLGPPGFDFQFGAGLLRFTSGPPGPLTLSGLAFYDDAMTNPVNVLTVEVFNLDRELEFMASTTNNAYSLVLNPGIDVNAGETLRLIAKDNTNFINVSDHVVSAGEIASQSIQLDLVLDEYFRDLVDFPFYEADPPEFNQNAGPAVAQMVLNWIWWDQAMDPLPPLTFDDQQMLYNEGIANNETPGLFFFDSRGMRLTIQNNRPGVGYNFSIISDPDGAEMLKQISKWVDFTVTSAVNQGHPGNVPGAFPAYGDYSNWMAVRGIHTSEPAFPLPPDLEVFGFWINDPFPASLGGIGENSYKTSQEFLDTYYFALTTGDSFDGKFVAVLEPPEPEPDKNLSLVPSPHRFDQADKNLLAAYRGAGSPSQAMVDEVNRRIVKAAVEGASEQLLPYDDGFRSRFEQTVPGIPLMIHREGADYYAVPFKDGQTAVVILIDAENGCFKEASWVQDPVQYPPVSRKDIESIVRKELERMKLDVKLLPKADFRLVYDTNPYYPNWTTTVASHVFVVGQDGSLSVEPVKR